MALPCGYECTTAWFLSPADTVTFISGPGASEIKNRDDDTVWGDQPHAPSPRIEQSREDQAPTNNCPYLPLVQPWWAEFGGLHLEMACEALNSFSSWLPRASLSFLN